MADTAFSIGVIPSLDVPVDALDQAARTLGDFTPIWPQVAESLANTAQQRWPLKRRSGALRESLRWTGRGLGKGGIYRASSDALTIGSRVFYSGFSQYGAKHQPARKLLTVDENDTTKRLEAWARSCAAAAGLTVS